jgi:ferrous iron transport protein A
LPVRGLYDEQVHSHQKTSFQPAFTVNELIPLQLLAAGQGARIDQLLGSSADLHRLQEMGLRPGAWVEMVQPGSPCIIKLAGSKLCLRDANLFQVLVQPGILAETRRMPSIA